MLMIACDALLANLPVVLMPCLFMNVMYFIACLTSDVCLLFLFQCVCLCVIGLANSSVNACFNCRFVLFYCLLVLLMFCLHIVLA